MFIDKTRRRVIYMFILVTDLLLLFLSSWPNFQDLIDVGKMCKPKPSSEVELPRWNQDSMLDWK